MITIYNSKYLHFKPGSIWRNPHEKVVEIMDIIKTETIEYVTVCTMGGAREQMDVSKFIDLFEPLEISNSSEESWGNNRYNHRYNSMFAGIVNY